MGDLDASGQRRVALGRQLAAFRGAAGIRQKDLAPLVGYSRSTIANVETGGQNAPRDLWVRCDQVLNTSGVLTASYDRALRLERAERRQDAHTAGLDRLTGTDTALEPYAPPVGGADPEPGEGEPALDTVLRGLTAARLPWRPDTREPTDSALAGMTMAETAQWLLRLFLHLDDTYGGDNLYGTLSRLVTDMAPAVEDDPAGGLGAFGQLSQMTGWLALDADRHGAARRYLNTAVWAAHEADDPALAASALAYMSLQDTYRGRPASALSLARTAFESSGAVSPRVATMLATRLARAHASRGNATASQLALDKARSAFDRVGTTAEPLWASYVDSVELAAQAGACYLELGMAGPARAALRVAVGGLASAAPHRRRDQVHYLTRLAMCDLLDYDVEAACQTATEALQVAEAVGSARVVQRLRQFHDALAPFGANPAAVRFRDHFAATVGAHGR